MSPTPESQPEMIQSVEVPVNYTGDPVAPTITMDLAARFDGHQLRTLVDGVPVGDPIDLTPWGPPHLVATSRRIRAARPASAGVDLVAHRRSTTVLRIMVGAIGLVILFLVGVIAGGRL